MGSSRSWLVLLGVGVLWPSCASSLHVTRVEHPAVPVSSVLDAGSREYHQGPIDLRLGDPAALLIPEGCQARCAASAFAELDCAGVLLEARGAAWLWPTPQNEERLPGGAVVQWLQSGGDFVGVLVGAEGRFALMQRRSTAVGRSQVLELLRSYHTAQADRPQLNCPMVLE
jgi:hypothetical protein